MFCGTSWKSAAVLAALASCVSAAKAGVSFSNLDGAASWVWVEAENYSAKSGTFNVTNIASPGTEYSGQTTTGHYAGMMVANGGTDAGSYFVNTFTIPTSMSTGYLYVHGTGAQYAKVNVYTGTDTTGTQMGQYTLYGANVWKSLTLGSYTAGSSVSLTQAAVLNYQNTRIDGFFVASQALTPSTTALNGTYYWMQAPTFTADVPTLTSTAFTPTVTDAPVGATYWVNGVLQPDGFGVIANSGLYNLVIKTSTGDILAGASFNFVAVAVPEPASLAGMAAGCLLLARRRGIRHYS